MRQRPPYYISEQSDCPKYDRKCMALYKFYTKNKKNYCTCFIP